MDHPPGFGDFDAALIRERTFVESVEIFDELPSTNDYALQTASQRPLPRLIIAARQTAGRGRLGRAWWSGEGSLAASLVIRPGEMEIPGERVPRVALAVGLAVLGACENFYRDKRLGLRWPNDVYLQDRKLAGVLCESASSAELVMGMGVNINNTAADAPLELRDRIVTLCELRGEPIPPLDFVVAVLGQIKTMLDALAREPEQLAARCDRRLLQKGRSLTVQTGGQTLRGRCLGIAPDGALMLETADGRRSVYSGSVLQ